LSEDSRVRCGIAVGRCAAYSD